MDQPFDLAGVDRLLSTTRAVRRRLDFSRPVSRELILDCIRLSQQAPTQTNSQSWRWLVVTDPALRRELGAIYARGGPAIEASALDAKDEQTSRVYAGARWLADHIHEAPALAIPCVVGRPPEKFHAVAFATLYGSILQAVWSFQLALRSRGLGSCFTTLHLAWEADVRALLGIPDDVLQVALLPVAYTRGGAFRPAARPPVESIVSWDRWGSRAR